jgi:hypothetical protein
MKLNRCEIRNFRSIKYINFSFDNNFICLVGLNEAGKSNILKALSFLDSSQIPDNLDIRLPDHEEEPVKDSHVWFIFTLDNFEQEEVLKLVGQTFEKFSPDAKIIKNGNKKLSMMEIVKYHKEGLYCVDIIEKTKDARYWSAFAGWEMIGDWREIPDNWAKKSQLENPQAQYIEVSADESLKNDSALKQISSTNINGIVGRAIISIINREIPASIKWKYESSHVLPGVIAIAGFVEKPASCEPLKNMFELAGYSDAAVAIATSQKNDPEFGMKNLLRRVSSSATTHLHSVWPEYKKLKIKLEENGTNIKAFIEDEHNAYSLDRRSDGFKRFLTFLLMISVKVKSETLSNTLLIIDEPDIALHPSGAVFLRKELMKISKTNKVVIATHSIFMIDKERIDRNIIVKKDSECTTMVSDYSASMLDEEVIFKALGYSLYDLLKEKNLVFEGWTDKSTFAKWIKSMEGKRKYSEWQKIGLIHSIGSKDVGRVANDLENLERKYLIITDSDQPSIEAQKRFSGQGTWITYKDLGYSIQETIEDFIEKNYVIESIKKTAQLDGLGYPTEIENENNFNAMIKKCGVELRLSLDEQKSFAKKVKSEIFENLSVEKIEIEDLVQKIDLNLIR